MTKPQKKWKAETDRALEAPKNGKVCCSASAAEAPSKGGHQTDHRPGDPKTVLHGHLLVRHLPTWTSESLPPTYLIPGWQRAHSRKGNKSLFTMA